ncbi:hypothetical protein LINPERPRIM_LOCUS27880 [Linum perenne]
MEMVTKHIEVSKLVEGTMVRWSLYSDEAYCRYEHREENRKDCLRTLLSVIEEAGKANKLAEDARVSYVKSRLKANPAFMERLRAKVGSRSCNTVTA